MLKLFFLMSLLLACSTVKAADYRLMCNVKEIGANKMASAYKIWIEFDLEPRYFRLFVQDGKTLKRLRDGFPQEVDDRRIVIVNDGIIQEHYERTDKKYFYKNDATGSEISGDCMRSATR